MSEVEEVVGKVIHFFPKISVCIVSLTDDLRVGDEIVIKGKTTMLRQTVESMQIEHKPIETAKAGQSIGLKVNGRVREGDTVYRVTKSKP
jgi:putative protease